ncbi:hypothetical protein ACG92U_05025 [Leuconostoc citreum]
MNILGVVLLRNMRSFLDNFYEDNTLLFRFSTGKNRWFSSIRVAAGKRAKKLGHDVSIMYPGRINIAKRQTYMQYATREEIKTIEIVNSLPLPLIGNIGDPRKYMTPIKSESLKDFCYKKDLM